MHNSKNKELFLAKIDLLMKNAIKSDNAKVLQRTINIFNFELLKVDGILGNITRGKLINTLLYVSEDEFDLIYSTLSEDKVGYNVIMNFLATWESTRIHYNRGESSFTTAYGVYKAKHPDSKPVLYVEQLGNKYNIKVNTRRGARMINTFITKEEKQRLKDLCYFFYMDNFMNEDINKHFDKNKMVKSKLTYFSNGVNGGTTRANKVLQKAIRVHDDGKIGIVTLNELKKHVDDYTLNKSMVRYMYKYYNSLVKHNPDKYKRFLNGWNNRLESLK